MHEQAEMSLQLQATVLETIARGGKLKQTIDQLCELVEGVIGDAVCSTMVLDTFSGTLDVFAAPNAPPDFIEKLSGLVPSDFGGSCGTAVYQKRPVYVCDTSTDPRWKGLRPIAEEYGISACWSVPILSKDDIAIGSFAVSLFRQRGPTPFEHQVLVTASHIAGFAIEHHTAIDALQASEEKFRDLFDRAPDMFVSVDARSGAITECNLTLLNKLRYSRQELIGRPLIDIYHPRCHARAERCAQTFLETGSAHADELQLFARNGDVIDVSLNVSAVRDADGRIIRSRSIFRDVSERKQTEQKLRHRAAYQALLVDLSSQLICARSAGLDEQLDYCLERVGAGYGLDAISLWWLTSDRSGIRQVRRWERSEARDLPGYRHRAESEWLSDHFQAGATIVVNDLLDIPTRAASEREEFRRWGTKSFVMVPMLVDGTPEGVVFYSTLRHTRSWSPDDVGELKLVSDTLASAIARSEAMAEIENLKNRLQEENIQLKDEIRAAHGFDEIIGNNAQLKRSLRLVEKVAPTDVAVLILGQTGTGKELIARALHKLSARRDQTMVSVNCPALPSNLIESALFGHEKGAFTGAHSRRKGRFELASGGTLFLDELGDLPLDLQSKLLRVLQSGEFERLGGTETLRANVRLIAATNRDLGLAVDRGEFRADLYYRINNFPIQLPALCERSDDIPLLAEHFVRKHARRLGKDINAIASSTLDELMRHSWPGNIRELESVIERALISSPGGAALRLASPLKSAPSIVKMDVVSSGGERIDLAAVERSHILHVLERTEWTISGADGAAAALGMPPSTLRSRMKRLGINRENQFQGRG